MKTKAKTIRDDLNDGDENLTNLRTRMRCTYDNSINQTVLRTHEQQHKYGILSEFVFLKGRSLVLRLVVVVLVVVVIVVVVVVGAVSGDQVLISRFGSFFSDLPMVAILSKSGILGRHLGFRRRSITDGVSHSLDSVSIRFKQKNNRSLTKFFFREFLFRRDLLDLLFFPNLSTGFVVSLTTMFVEGDYPN
jgi:hypothetical protein